MNVIRMARRVYIELNKRNVKIRMENVDRCK